MHTDPELLGLLALGEDVGTEDERRHAQTCAACSRELSELGHLATLGRSVSAETTIDTPSVDVWAKIRDELAFASTLEPPADQAAALPSDIPGLPTVASPLGPIPAAHAATGQVRKPLLAGIKAALARVTPGSGPEPTAHAQLTPVERFWADASGTAELATDELGRRLLLVALQADLPTSGVRQAWLVHRDDPNLRQSLGVLDGPHGLWTVEHSIDVEQYAILDISQQGTGQTEHSGQTIVRGELTLVG